MTDQATGPHAEDDGGDRHSLRRRLSPDAPPVAGYRDAAGAYGYVHSWEAGSTVDGPGTRMTVFMSGCLLRCQYCHNPDTWHLHDGRRREAGEMLRRIAGFAPALRSVHGGLTISGGEPLVQTEFTRRLFRGAAELGLHTALDTSGYLGAHADADDLSRVDLVLLDIKAWGDASHRRVTGVDAAPTLAFAERLAAMGKPVWVRFVLVPGLTDDADEVAGLARFVAPMRNVEWVEVLPFHQLGAFKWQAMKLDYRLAGTPPCPPDLLARVVGQFRKAGCNAR